jgi:hypothetical protein
MNRNLLPVENDLAVRLETLFERYPALHGFTVKDYVPQPGEHHAMDEGMLAVADVSVFPMAGAAEQETICNDIAQTLTDFLSERPGAHVLLRGRTIARVLH